MSDILNYETKIRYTINRNEISYETVIEHIKNMKLAVTIHACKQLTINICYERVFITIIISKSAKYSIACDTMMKISKNIHIIELVRFDDYYISKEHINLINLLVGDHYVKFYDHYLICDLPIYFEFKFENLTFYINLDNKDEFNIHQQIDYMFEMIKFYNPKTMSLKFEPLLFRNYDFDAIDEIVKYINIYLSEQNIEFVNSGNRLEGYHIRCMK